MALKKLFFSTILHLGFDKFVVLKQGIAKGEGVPVSAQGEDYIHRDFPYDFITSIRFQESALSLNTAPPSLN